MPVPDGGFTYYTVPIATQLIPPGGPIRGGTTLTIRGSGFGGLGTSMASLRCVFGDSMTNAAVDMSEGGDEVVCHTTATAAGDRNVRLSLNDQDYDAIETFRFYERPKLNAITPTGGPTLAAFTVTLHGFRFGGMDGVSMPYAPLCRLGSLVGDVLSMGVEAAAAAAAAEDEDEDEDEEDDEEEALLPTYSVCVVPRPIDDVEGLVTVRLALNGQDFDDGMPDDTDAYTLETGLVPTPQEYLYYQQVLTPIPIYPTRNPTPTPNPNPNPNQNPDPLLTPLPIPAPIPVSLPPPPRVPVPVPIPIPIPIPILIPVPVPIAGDRRPHAGRRPDGRGYGDHGAWQRLPQLRGRCLCCPVQV